MKLSIFGKVHTIEEKQTFENDFEKQCIVVKNSDDGVKFYLEFHRDNIKFLESINVGQDVVVYFYVNGNEFAKKDANGNPTDKMIYTNPFVAYALSKLQNV